MRSNWDSSVHVLRSLLVISVTCYAAGSEQVPAAECLGAPPDECDEGLPGYFFHSGDLSCEMTQFAFCLNASNSFEFLEECELHCLGHETDQSRRLEEEAREHQMHDSEEQISRKRR